MVDVEALLRRAQEMGASDLHLAVEAAPSVRLDGRLLPLDVPPLSADETLAILRGLASAEQVGRVLGGGEADFSYSLAGVGRFRVGAFRQRGTVCLALRLIPHAVPTCAAISLPEAASSLVDRPAGLVLVTGRAGSGKSTTLAALVDRLNTTRHLHIVTLEEPIEYLHRHQLSIVNQREIGMDSPAFPQALRAALREDADAILVGDMRDGDTALAALAGAETGHLLLAALPAADAVQALERVIASVPAERQSQTRLLLADTLVGVIYQELLVRADRPGRIAAFEVLLATPAARNLIREGKTHQLPSLVQTGGRFGMQSLETSLRALLARGAIAAEDVELRLASTGRA